MRLGQVNAKRSRVCCGPARGGLRGRRRWRAGCERNRRFLSRSLPCRAREFPNMGSAWGPRASMSRPVKRERLERQLIKISPPSRARSPGGVWGSAPGPSWLRRLRPCTQRRPIAQASIRGQSVLCGFRPPHVAIQAGFGRCKLLADLNPWLGRSHPKLRLGSLTTSWCIPAVQRKAGAVWSGAMRALGGSLCLAPSSSSDSGHSPCRTA